ncbi:GTF2E2 [Cordylochernes scorpioides]|uniref:GTF2E2 n=1 Tax=Cordylochernes scorpioides TaxID=51811 RepID=A0ABY6LTF0_9ARAC|nr:GTF2E2 [Cordylochernes scorpioides]
MGARTLESMLTDVSSMWSVIILLVQGFGQLPPYGANKHVMLQMDPELLRQKEAFKKRALYNPVVEAKKKESSSAPPPKKKAKSTLAALSQKLKQSSRPADPYSYKTKSAGSQNNFSILAKIVKHMKLVEVYGEKCMDIKNVRKWCREFNEGWINVHDEQWSGRPSLPESTVARIDEMVRANRRITLEEIEDGLNEDCSHFSKNTLGDRSLRQTTRLPEFHESMLFELFDDKQWPLQKKRHQDGDTHPLNLEEILDETNQLSISTRQKHWLSTEVTGRSFFNFKKIECRLGSLYLYDNQDQFWSQVHLDSEGLLQALVNNPKIQVNPDKTYIFKPIYNLKDKKSLMRLLDKHDQRALGGILLEDVEESLPNAERIIKNLGDQVTCIVRSNDKKKVLFYNDKSLQQTTPITDAIVKHWRSTAIGGIEDQKIEEYLHNQGISTMQEVKPKPVAPIQKRRMASKKRPKKFKVHNEHMEGILEDYNV